MSRSSVLVVCLGNVCRSPVAERLLRLRLDRLVASAEVDVMSAGVLAMAGSPMDAQAAAQLTRLGGDPEGFVSRQLDSSMVESADLVLVASRDLRTRVIADSPRAFRRTFTLRDFATLCANDRGGGSAGLLGLVKRGASQVGALRVEDSDVPDPVGRSESFHRDVADMLDHACTVVASAVADNTAIEPPAAAPQS